MPRPVRRGKHSNNHHHFQVDYVCTNSLAAFLKYVADFWLLTANLKSPGKTKDSMTIVL